MRRLLAILCFLGVQALVGVVLLIVFACVVLSHDGTDVGEALADGAVWRGAGVVFAVVCVLQLAVLLPVRRRRPRSERGVPVWVSLGGAALLVALLVGAFAIAVFDGFAWKGDGLRLATGLAAASAAWGVALFFFSRMFERSPDASREELLHRVTKSILKGTAFETVALIPLDVMIRRRDTCYCVAGTVLGWAVSFAVGLVVLGPAVLLPILARRRQRWYAERCNACATPLALADAHAGGGYRAPTIASCSSCGIRVPLAARPMS